MTVYKKVFCFVLTSSTSWFKVSIASRFETKTQKSIFSLVRKCWLQASGVVEGCAPVCLQRLNESNSHNLRWLKGFSPLAEPSGALCTNCTQAAGLRPGYHLALASLSGIMICSRWYFRAANAFPFSLHSPHPRCSVDCCCCGICTTPFIFTWRKQKRKKDMPKRENARKVKPCYNNTCIVVLVVCSTNIGKSAESNTPIFYTAAAFAPHPHTIRLG